MGRYLRIVNVMGAYGGMGGYGRTWGGHVRVWQGMGGNGRVCEGVRGYWKVWEINV